MAILDDTHDERTPLLSPPVVPKITPRARKEPTPLPKFQLSILLVLQLAEPITSQCIYPFINALIRELDITGGNDRKVGYYAGMIQSLFFLTEACTVLQWSRISDHVGRKPILLIGLFGLSISMLLFGLARTFWALVVSRCLAGVLNGNVGIMKSMMAEITDNSNRGKGVSLLPMVWSAGATIGPLIGGQLARPHERFPNVFKSEFWIQYPYFLPCATAAGFSAFAFILTLLFLKETVKLRGSILSNFFRRRKMFPANASSLAEMNLPPPDKVHDAAPLRSLLTPKVLIAILNYNLLSLMDIVNLAIFPLFCSTPISHGGLGLEPATIGLILGGWGFVTGVFQAFAFAEIIGRWGARRVFAIAMGCFVPIFALYPLINVLARNRGLDWLTWTTISVQLLLFIVMDLAWGCSFMYVTAAAPRNSLGATNGLAQSTTSLMRAIGPAASTSLFALSIDRNIMGGTMVYVVLVSISFFAAMAPYLLTKEGWRDPDDED